MHILNQYIKVMGLSLFILTFCIQCLSDPTINISFQSCIKECSPLLDKTYPNDSVCLIAQYYLKDSPSNTTQPVAYTTSIIDRKIVIPTQTFKPDTYDRAKVNFLIYDQNIQQLPNTIDFCSKDNFDMACEKSKQCVMKVNIVDIPVLEDGLLDFASGICQDEQQACNL